MICIWLIELNRDTNGLITINIFGGFFRSKNVQRKILVYDLGILLCLCLISFTTSFIVYGDDYVMVVKFACLFDFILNHKNVS